jgi:ankyrin repeat protein
MEFNVAFRGDWGQKSNMSKTPSKKKNTPNATSRKAVRAEAKPAQPVIQTPLPWSELAKKREAIHPPSIHEAAKHGQVEIVKTLLKNNPKLVHSKNDYGWTPLHWAAWTGHTAVAEVLLANKAEVNVRTNHGNTPLHDAAYKGKKEMAKLLLSKKAEVNAGDRNGMTPLHLAAEFGHKELVELLLSKKAATDARGLKGWTPLHFAAARGCVVSVKLLLAKLNDVNIKDTNGMTPMHLASDHHHAEVAELIHQHGGHD